MLCGRVGVGWGAYGGGKEKRLYFTANIEEELDSVMMRIFSDISWVKNKKKEKCTKKVCSME